MADKFEAVDQEIRALEEAGLVPARKTNHPLRLLAASAHHGQTILMRHYRRPKQREENRRPRK
jgi:hypothetical protein